MLKKLLFTLIFLLFAQSSFATTYWVDCDAAPGGDGSIFSQWDEIADVNGASFLADDNINIAKGCTWRETLVVPSSGTSGHPITFGAYGTGDRPLLKPSFVIGANWIHYSGSGDTEVWKFTGTDEVRVLWLSDDWVVYGGTGDDPVAGQWKRDAVDNTIVYYNPTGSTNPNTLTLSWGRGTQDYTMGININVKDYIDIDGLKISNAPQLGFWFRNANHINVRNSIASKCGSHVQAYPAGVGNGFGVQYDSHNILFENDESFNNWDIGFSIEGLGNEPSNITYKKCNAHDNGSGLGTGQSMQGFSSASTTSGKYVDTVLYEDCVSTGNKHNGARLTRATNVTFSRFKTTGSYYSGIYLSTLSSNTHILYSLIYDNNKNNNAGTYSGNVEVQDLAGGLDGLTIYNSVLALNTGTAGTGLRIGATTLTNFTMKNTVLWGNTYVDLRVQKEYGAGCVLDYNSYSNTNGSSGVIIRYDNTISPARTYTVAQFATYQATESQDAHSFIADPLFVNPSGGDFRLLGSSPAIDKGVDVGLTLDYRGTKVPRGSAPDMGVLEYWTKTSLPADKVYLNPMDIRRFSIEQTH